MPYASHIQLVNDPNGTAYAFLADNGAIWQCQWDAQAGGWVKGQVVPQAFGGEKLQALNLDDLWPTLTSNTNGTNPGIVLAYRLGEGSSAEIWASFGTWADDGSLQWMAPQQLTKDQVDDQTFSLVEGVAGGFDLVVQKKEAGAGSSTTLDKQIAASTADLQAKLEADISGARPDSDLYVNQYKLQMKTGSTTEVVLNDITAGQLSAVIQSAVIQTPKAAAPMTLTGDTQLSRQDLIQPLATATTASVLGSGGGGGDPTGTSWNAFQTKLSGGGTLRVGLTNQSIMRWELNLPANYNIYKQKKLIDQGWSENFDNENSVDSESEKVISGGSLPEESIPNYSSFTNESRSSLGGSILDQSEEEINFGADSKAVRNSEKLVRLVRLLDGGAGDLSTLSGALDLFATSKSVEMPGKEINLKWRGAFGIGNFGASGLTSLSGQKLIFGYGNEDAASMGGAVTEAVEKSRIIGDTSPLSAKTTNYGIGGSAQSIYQYSNRFFQTPNLTNVIARESVGLDYSQRTYRTSASEEATIRTAFSANSGYEFTQAISSEQLPGWLAGVGYASGIAGKVERILLTGKSLNGRRTINLRKNDPY
jgi:hypothetical protein